MALCNGKGRILICSNSTLILAFAIITMFIQVNCEVTVFKGDPTIPKAQMKPDEIRSLNFVNRPRQPRQDDGEDGGDGGGDTGGEYTAMMPAGLAGVLNQFFGNGSAFALLPQIIRTFDQIGQALNGSGNQNIGNFLNRQGAQAGSILQRLTGGGGGQMAQGPQSILQILDANRRPIGGVIPNRGPPGAANGAMSQQAQMELLLMAMMMQMQNKPGGVQGAVGVQVPGQGVSGAGIDPNLQNQLVQLAIQQQKQQLLGGQGAAGPPEDYSVEDIGQHPIPTEVYKYPPTAPPSVTSAPYRASSSPPVTSAATPPSAPKEPSRTPSPSSNAPAVRPAPLLSQASTPQLFKEIAQLASKLPDQGHPTNSTDSDIIPNLWELYAYLQTLPQYKSSTPSPTVSSPSISSQSGTPTALNLIQLQLISQNPELFSNALLQSIKAATSNLPNTVTQKPQQIKPQLAWKPPTPSPFSNPTKPPAKKPQQTEPQLAWKPPTPSPFVNPTQPPTEPPSFVYPPANKPSSLVDRPAYVSTHPEPTPQRRPPVPQRLPPTAPPPPQYTSTLTPSLKYPPPENTLIYTGSLHALKAQSMNQRPEEENPANQGPHFVKSPTSSQYTLPIGGYVPAVVSVFENIDSVKSVGPQPDIYDEFNGFGFKAPYTPVKNGILIDTPRLRPSTHDIVKRPPVLVPNTEQKQTSAIFPANHQKYPDGAYQGTNVNSLRQQQQQQQIFNKNQNIYGAFYTTTASPTTRDPPPPPTAPPPPQLPQGPVSPPESSSLFAAIKEIQSRPVTTTSPKPYRLRSRATSKKPSLLNGPIYWMNMFYPKGVSTEKSSIYKFER